MGLKATKLPNDMHGTKYTFICVHKWHIVAKFE